MILKISHKFNKTIKYEQINNYLYFMFLMIKIIKL
jgi:hypothetical protein